jgi:hypothetical protein
VNRTTPVGSVPVEAATVRTLRRFLIWTFSLGAAGMATELLLLEHVDGWQQVLPVALLLLSLPLSGWFAARPSAAAVRALQGTMVLFMVGGAAGSLLHYRGNTEFELEMYPTMAGIELFTKTMTGATPVLAPGTMILLGLVGLAATYRHPSLAVSDSGGMQ